MILTSTSIVCPFMGAFMGICWSSSELKFSILLRFLMGYVGPSFGLVAELEESEVSIGLL